MSNNPEKPLDQSGQSVLAGREADESSGLHGLWQDRHAHALLAELQMDAAILKNHLELGQKNHFNCLCPLDPVPRWGGGIYF